MKRLPNVKAVVSQVLDQVDIIRQDEAQKTASVEEPSFTIPVAGSMHKLAAALRNCNTDRVTYAEVHEFAEQLLE